MNLIKRKRNVFKNCAKSNLVYNKGFIFYKYHSTKEFAKPYFNSKRNDFIEFRDILKLSYDYTEELKPNNEEQEKDLEKIKVVTNTAFKLYDKLLNLYTSGGSKGKWTWLKCT